MIIYTVKKGDSIYSISSQYNVSMQRIIEANGLENPNNLVVGQAIIIPTDTEKIRSIEVNGYAYPNIATNVLEDTLPYLTYISPFSYEARSDGSIKQIDDTTIRETARLQNVAPMMVITNIDENGSFSSELGEVILTNIGVQNNLINNIVNIMNEKNYYGVDIDFEYLYPRNRDDYTGFLIRLVDRMHSLGYIVTTAVAPKVSGSQSGLLYEAHDYGAHGVLVDHIIIMTYEWGYTYGSPMAVAPLDQVERVLRYAVSMIPSRKILMGMPNYGYDWTLPYESGTAAKTISNSEAVNLAYRVGAEIRFDEKSQAPFFNYYDVNGKEHIVWFDDARSIDARLRLIQKYNLGGASYWTINRFFKPNWTILSSLYDISKLI